MIAVMLREEAHEPGLLQVCQGTVEAAFAHMLYAAEELARLNKWQFERFSTQNRCRHHYRIKELHDHVGQPLPVFVFLQVICSRRFPRAIDGQLRQRYFWQVKAEGGNLARRAFEKLLERPCHCGWNDSSTANDH